MGTMTYKHRSLEDQLDAVREGIGHLNVNLKLIPDVDGSPKIAQLVGYRLKDIHVPRRLGGRRPAPPDPARELRRRRPAGAPDRPRRHQIVDFTLPYGEVLHDYLA